jgi:hypothetical protein
MMNSTILQHPKNIQIFLLPGATDADTSDNNITFTLSPGGGQGQMGFMSFKSRPNVPIHSFSQEDLARSKVLFTHTGKTETTIKRTFSFMLQKM